MPLPTLSIPPPSESQDSSENSIPVPEPPELPTSLPPIPLSSETKKANSAKRAVGRGKSTRGGAFSSREGVSLAKAWVQQSLRVSEQNETTFWEGVEKECTKDGMSRSAAMLKSKWSWLQRSTQKYLAARTTVLGLQISGASPDDIAQQTMRVFRERAATKGQGGKVVLAPVFKFVEAANYLSTQPKFNVLYSGNSKTTSSYRSSEVKLHRETGA